MSNFETVVLGLVLSLFTPNLVAAEGADAFTKLITSQALDCVAPTTPNGGNDPSYLKCLHRQELSDTANNCRSLQDQYNKAKTDFTDACKTAHLGSKCVAKIVKCDQELDKEAEGGGRSRSSNQPLDVDAEDAKLKKCPAMAGEDLDKYEKQLKDQQEKVKKLEDEMPGLEDKANKVISDTNDKLNEIKKQQTDLAATHAKEVKEAARGQQDAQKAITNQINAIQLQISQGKDELAKGTVAKLDAQIKLKQAKIQAQLQCHADATTQVGKMQAGVITQIQTGTYNRGSFTNLMKNVGLSDRDQWQRVALKYYNWCLQSKLFTDTVDAANDNYTLGLTAINAQDNSTKDKIAQLQAQQLQLSNPAGCTAPGSAGETAICQAARQANEDAQQAEVTYRTQVDAANEKYMSLQKQGTTEYNTLKSQAVKKKQELDAEQTRLDNLKEFLQVKYDHGGNSDIDSKAISDASAKRNDLIEEGKEYIGCLGDNSRTPDGVNYCKQGTCANVLHFLNKDLDYNPEPPIDTTKRALDFPDAAPVQTVAAPTTTPPVPTPDDGGATGSK